MASTLSVFNPPGVRASAVPRKPDQNRQKASQPAWWSPIFGWSSDPDYINVGESADRSSAVSEEGKDSEMARSRSRFAPGCFTEEKAKQLRRKTMESSTFHDVMYHSSIASRLASDMPDL